MIDAADAALLAWVREVVGPLPVVLTLPDPALDAAPASGVCCYLLELADRAPLRNMERAPLQIDLRYLITTWASTAEEAHRLLGDLVFAALDAPDFMVDLRSLEAGTWQALGMVPQPSCILQVPLRKERPVPTPPLVTEPLSIRTVPVAKLHGVVVGPDERPLARVAVEIQSLQLATRTDAAGRFQFPMVPRTEGPTILTVRAKGRLTRISVSERSFTMEPLTIHADLPHVERPEP